MWGIWEATKSDVWGGNKDKGKRKRNWSGQTINLSGDLKSTFRQLIPLLNCRQFLRKLLAVCWIEVCGNGERVFQKQTEAISTWALPLQYSLYFCKSARRRGIYIYICIYICRYETSTPKLTRTNRLSTVAPYSDYTALYCIGAIPCLNCATLCVTNTS